MNDSAADASQIRRNFLFVRKNKRVPIRTYLYYIWEDRTAQYRPLHLHLCRNIYDRYDREPASRRGHLWEDSLQPRRVSAWHLAIGKQKSLFRFFSFFSGSG